MASSSISSSPSKSASLSISSSLSASASPSPGPPTAPYGRTWNLNVPSKTILAGNLLGVDVEWPAWTIVSAGVEAGRMDATSVPYTIEAYGTAWLCYISVDVPSRTISSYGAGDVDVTRGFYTLTAHGTVEYKGTIDVEVPVRTVTAVNGGIASVEVPTRTIDASSTTGFVGSVDVTMPRKSLIASGKVEILGSITGNVPSRLLTAKDLANVIGRLNVTSLRRTIIASGYTGEIGWVDQERAFYTIEASGYVEVTGTVVEERPFYTIDSGTLTYITVGTEKSTSFALMMSVVKQAVTEADQMTFESLAMFNGKAFGANSSGLYELTGNDDSGNDIKVEVETGAPDFGVGNAKKPWTLHFNMIGEGKLQAYLEGARDVEITAKESKFQDGGLKIKHSRDTRSTYWGVRFKNIDGTNFKLNGIDLIVEVLGLREDY